MRVKRQDLRVLLLAAVVATAAACRDNIGPQPRIPSALRVETTAALRGVPGFPIADSVAVRLVDRNGAGVPGFTVDFAVVSGGGSAAPSSVTTDAEGYARAQWTLGGTAGEQSLRATVRDMSLPGVTVQAAAEFGRERTVIALTAASLGTVIGSCTIAQDIQVRVVDAAGVPVADAEVDFTATAAGKLDPAVARTDAQGIARSKWTPGPGAGEQRATASLRVPGSTPASIRATVLPRAPNGFAAIGTTLIGPDCAPYIIRGITRPSLEWEPFGDPNFGSVATDFANMKSWGANTVRLPVNQTYWVQGSAHYVAGYRDHVIQTVAKARAAGLNVIFDLHIGDRGEANFNPLQGMPQMPDVNHSLPFWRDVARVFKNDGGVIFELYNEPHDISVEVWRNGGLIPAGETYAGGPVAAAYQAVGMQQLYDAVRAEGAENLIILGGMHWGYYLNEIAQKPVAGYNIAYSAHPYDWPDKQPEFWERDWGFMAATYPIVVTEFGAYECSRLEFYTKFLDYAEQKKISWVSWAWWTPPEVSANYSAAERQQALCRFPSLIADWNGTPTASGAVVKERLSRPAVR